MKTAILVLSVISVLIGLIMVFDKKGRLKKLLTKSLFLDSDTDEIVEMEEEYFWEIIETTKNIAGGDLKEHKNLLVNKLSNLPPEQIILFQNRFMNTMTDLYHWKYWAIAAILQNDCDEECFTHFRSWIITQGKGKFLDFYKDPNAILDFDVPPPEDRFPDFRDSGEIAFLEKTGNPFKSNVPDINFPFGEEWEDEDLPQLFPEVWEQFRKKS